MSFNVYLVSAHHPDRLLDGITGVALYGVLPEYTDESFPLLRFIDPYGNTFFNQLQMKLFLEKWSRLFAFADECETEVLQEIERLAKECQKRVHLLLHFLGD